MYFIKSAKHMFDDEQTKSTTVNLYIHNSPRVIRLQQKQYKISNTVNYNIFI